MLALLKYELQGRYKLILGSGGAIILWNIYLFTRYGLWNVPYGKIEDGGIIFLSVMTGFVGAVAAFLAGIELFRRDLYTDTGYLVFSLPNRAYVNAGSKLMVSLLEYLGFTLLSGIMVLIHIWYFQPDAARKAIIELLTQFWPGITYAFVYSMLLFIAAMITVYFALALSKTAFGRSRYGMVAAFGIVIALGIFISKIHAYLTQALPYNVILNTGTAFNESYGSMAVSVSAIHVNISGAIFDVLVYAGLFAVTLYLLDNKVDI